MNSQGNDKQVQGTNNSSITSKLSACEKGYFTDPYLKYFVDKPRVRSSIINRGYHVRAVNMEQGFDKILNLMTSYPQSQIISLGAGFDTTYFKLKSAERLKNCTYIEVDFDPVLRRKKDIILSTPVLKELLSNFNSISSDSSSIILQASDYLMVTANLSNVKGLETAFEKANIDFNLPTAFVSECVLNYLDTESADNLIKWIASRFPDSLFLVYDQINPFDGFGTIMMNHFSSIGTPLGSIHRYSSTQDQVKRYKDLGWVYCDCKDVSDTYSSMLEEELERIISLEMFDEYEEFDLLCLHYFALIATRGKLADKIGPSQNQSVNLTNEKDKVNVSLETSNQSLERFGHCATLICSDKVVLIGGFGPNSNGHHERLKGITTFQLNKDFELETFDIENNILGARMFSQIFTLPDESLFILGGRASPNSDAFKTLVKLVRDSSSDWNAEEFKINLFDSDSFPLWRHSCSYDNLSQKIIIFGGINKKRTILSNMFLLDLNTLEWKQGTSKRIGRHSHSSVIYKRCVLISGGRTQTTLMGLIEAYDISNDSWSSISTIPEQKPRYSHTSHIVKGDILLLLGGIVQRDSFVSLINLHNYHCVHYELPSHSPTTYPQLFVRHSSFVKEDEDAIKIATYGGGGNCFSFGTHFDRNCLISIPNLCN